jgi:uncharacterized lipoprotein YddW (UPF0748 family)
MKPALLSVFLLSIALVLPSDNLSSPGPLPSVRALWVVRTTLVSPGAVREMVRRAKENQYTDLIVQVRGRGDAFYKSRWEPRAMELAGQPDDFDPLALTLAEGRKAGLRIHAWINTFLTANMDVLPAGKDHAIYRHPE